MALLKLEFKPGVNKEDTPYTAEGGWVESDKIRFRSGRPEKIKGWENYQNTTVEGVARRLHSFRTLDGTNYLAIGTNEKVYVETGGTFIDITPIRATLTTSTTDNCVITDGSTTTVTINVVSHGCDDGAWVTISGVADEDGSVDTVTEAGTSTGTATFTAVAQTSTSGSGTGATFDVSASGGTYTVTAVAAGGSGYAVSDTITIAGTSLGGASPANDLTLTIASLGAIGGVPISEINAEHKITYVDVDNFQITVSTASTSAVAGGGGTAIDIACQLNPGPIDGTFQYGFGSGAWAAGTWGTPRSSAIPLDPRIWNFASWGEDLIMNFQGGSLYYWDASTATDRATLITQAPYKVDHILVTRDRHLVCFGCNPPGTANQFELLDHLQIRWCSQEDYTAWNVTSTNTAGDQLLTNGTRIVGAEDVESQVIIWTDSDVQSMQFLGPPYTFGFNQIGTHSGMISSRGAAAYNNVVYWMGDSAFYIFQGGTNVLPCTVQRYVFEGLDLSQRKKVFTSVNRKNNEITWFYPAISQHPRYVAVGVGTADTTIQLQNTAGLPNAGQVQIDSELIDYTSKNDTKLFGCTRAVAGTTAATHAVLAAVTSSSWTKEAYHTVTYNVIDKIWWIGTLERTAMIDSGELSNPVAADYNGQLFYHETGYDAAGDPIFAYVQSGDFDIAEGDKLMFVHRFVPDFTVIGSVDVTMQTKYYPLDTEAKETIGTVGPSTERINTRIRARNMALRIESDSSGDWWKYGSSRIDQRTDGRR